jgi:hypothetical protein
VSVAVILARTVVAVAGDWFVGGKLFKPCFIVLVESRFSIIDEDRCRDMHGVYEHESFRDATFEQARLYLGSNVYETSPGGQVEIKLLPV